MRSFAIWYEKRNQSSQEEAKLDIHINLWKAKKINEYSFDYGLKIENIEEIGKIHIYIPFRIQTITDLGKLLKNNTNLVSAVFNEKCSVDVSYPNRMKVINESGDKCIIYSLNKRDYEITDIDQKGSVVTFSLGSILNNNEKKSLKDIKDIKTYYIRFRFSALAKNISMIKDQESEKGIFSNMFKKVEIIDFRINDERSWSEEIKQDYVRGSAFKIMKIHYLMLRDANDEFIYYDGAIKTRILEKEIWSSYIENLERDIMTYHIKKSVDEKKEIKSFVCLTRFKYVEESKLLLFFYGVIAVFLSVCASSVYTIFIEKIKSVIKPLWESKKWDLGMHSNIFVIILSIIIIIFLLKCNKKFKKK